MAGSDINTSIKYRCRHLLRGMWLLAGSYAVFYMVVPVGTRVFEDSIFLGFSEAMGGPQGIEDVFGFDHYYFVPWVTAFAIVGCAVILSLSRRALGPIPNVKRFTRTAALVIALMIAGICYGMTHVGWMERWPDMSSPISQLQTIRSQLELYQVQHEGNYPTLEQMWNNLVVETEVDGTIGDSSGDEFGPYLQQPPANRWSNDSAIASDNSGSWEYDETTGSIRIVVPPRIAACYEVGQIDHNIVAAPYEWADNSREPLAGKQLAALQSELRWKAIRMTPVLPALAFALAYLITVWLLPKVFREATLYDNVNSALATIGAIAVLLVPLFMIDFDRTGPLTIRVVCVFAFLWCLGCYVHLLYHPHYRAGWSDGSACLFCGYNLKGTRDAGRDVCPECGKQSSVPHTAGKHDQCREAA